MQRIKVILNRLEPTVFVLFALAVALLPFYGNYFAWQKGLLAPPVSKTIFGILSFSLVGIFTVPFLRRSLSWVWFEKIAIVLLIWMAVTLCWSFSERHAFYELFVWFAVFAIYWVVSRWSLSVGRVNAILIIVHFGAVLVSVLAVLQYWSGDDFLVRGKTTSASVFGNKNMAMHYLVLVLPISAYLLLKQHTTLWSRACVGVGLVFILLYIIHSQTRSAYVAILVALPVFFLLLKHQFSTGAWVYEKTVRALFSGLAACLFIALLLPSFLGRSAQEAAGLIGRGSSGRLCIWESSYQMVLQKPWFGWGAGSYEAMSKLYDSCGRAVYRVHNEYLQVLLELGAVGFVLSALILGFLVIFLSAPCIKAFKQQASLTHADSLKWVLLCVLLGTATQSLFTFPYQLPYVAVLLAVLLGLVRGLSTSPAQSSVLLDDDSVVRLWLARIRNCMLVAFFVFAVAVTYGWHKELGAYRNLLLGKSLTEQALRSPMLVQNVLMDKALDTVLYDNQRVKMSQPMRKYLLEQALVRTPNNIRVFHALGNVFEAQGDYPHAKVYLEAAVNVSANTGAYSFLAADYFDLIEKKQGAASAARVFEDYAGALDGVWKAQNRLFWHVPDQLQLAKMAFKYKQYPTVIASMQRALDADAGLRVSNPYITLLLGESYWGLNDYSNAQIWLNQYLANFPRHAEQTRARQLLRQVQAAASEENER